MKLCIIIQHFFIVWTTKHTCQSHVRIMLPAYSGNNLIKVGIPENKSRTSVNVIVCGIVVANQIRTFQINFMTRKSKSCIVKRKLVSLFDHICIISSQGAQYVGNACPSLWVAGAPSSGSGANV